MHGPRSSTTVYVGFQHWSEQQVEKTRQQLQICQLFVKLKYLPKLNLKMFLHKDQWINILMLRVFWILTSSPHLQDMPPKKKWHWIFRVFTPNTTPLFLFLSSSVSFRFRVGNAMQVTPHCVANRDISLPNVRRDPSRPTSRMPAWPDHIQRSG